LRIRGRPGVPAHSVAESRRNTDDDNNANRRQGGRRGDNDDHDDDENVRGRKRETVAGGRVRGGRGRGRGAAAAEQAGPSARAERRPQVAG